MLWCGGLRCVVVCGEVCCGVLWCMMRFVVRCDVMWCVVW